MKHFHSFQLHIHINLDFKFEQNRKIINYKFLYLYYECLVICRFMRLIKIFFLGIQNSISQGKDLQFTKTNVYLVFHNGTNVQIPAC